VLLFLQLAVCPLDEGCISFILARVLGALVYLHGAGRLHRYGTALLLQLLLLVLLSLVTAGSCRTGSAMLIRQCLVNELVRGSNWRCLRKRQQQRCAQA
jgi:hypothetical protein